MKVLFILSTNTTLKICLSEIPLTGELKQTEILKRPFWDNIWPKYFCHQKSDLDQNKYFYLSEQH